MTRIPLIASLVSVGLLLAAVPLAGSAVSLRAPSTTSGAAPVAFGMDAGSLANQAAAGAKPDYGTFWIGPWTLTSGWSGPDAQLDTLRAAGVTPAIQFYYWGDDISQACLTSGCWSSLHNAQLDQAHWQLLAQQLVDNLNAHLGGKPALIFLETEFNKNDVASYAPLDGMLADKAAFFHQNYPAAQVVMALGNWGSNTWGTWTRTAAASDFTGIQGMRGSTRDSLASYLGLYDATLAGAQTLQGLFHKPIVLTDIALSSYPEPAYLQYQHDALASFFAGLPALKAAGVQAMVYRSWQDTPMDPANYYGAAESYWGLANTAGQKPAAQVWLAGVQAERASAAPVPTPVPTPAPAPAPAFTAAFTPSASINAWWVDVKVTASSPPAKVEANDNNGPWHTLPATAWGTYAASFNAPQGSSVVFRATDALGATAISAPIAWLMPAGTSPAPTPAPAPAPAPAAFAATFTPSANVNPWWVDVKVDSASPIAAVSATVNGGAPHTLPKTAWGTWAASFYVAQGYAVVFTAKDGAGNTATSGAFAWLTGTTAPAPGFTATFSPKAVGNTWWVEVGVTSPSSIAKVEASLNGDAYTPLPKDAWGTYAKSLYVPTGTPVVFRATSSTGATATSAAVPWA